MVVHKLVAEFVGTLTTVFISCGAIRLVVNGITNGKVRAGGVSFALAVMTIKNCQKEAA